MEVGMLHQIPWGGRGRCCHVDILDVHAYIPHLPPTYPLGLCSWRHPHVYTMCEFSSLVMTERNESPGGGWVGGGIV